MSGRKGRVVMLTCKERSWYCSKSGRVDETGRAGWSWDRNREGLIGEVDQPVDRVDN